jgi:hypothetical protein
MQNELEEHVTGLAQKCIQDVPVIVLGSGASAAHGLPGMGHLSDWLCNLHDLIAQSSYIAARFA